MNASTDENNERIVNRGRLAGALILIVLAAVAIFLVAQALPALIQGTDEGESFLAYVLPLAFGTVWAAALALAMAIPVAIGIALFISHYAPRRLAAGLGYIIDLLAAVPPATPISVEVPHARLQARLSAVEFATYNLRAVQALLSGATSNV